MANSNNYTITFMSLRSGTTYTLNIGGGSGTAIPLKAGSQPFTTQESDDEDMFTPVRTQSGYLRIIDDGFDAQTPAQPFDWHDLIPETDISRPVTLTDSNGNVKWQGFLQAQNFGVTMYMEAQEIALPIQCAISTMSRIDAGATVHTGLVNFAAIIDYALSVVPVLSFTNIVIQGGADAMQWLMRRVDWDTFGETDEDGIFRSKHNVLSILENVCRYWGWTLRTKGQTIYMTCADDTSVFNFLLLTRAQLTTMAGGTPTGTIDTNGFDTLTVGDVFADTDNEDMQIRGVNKAALTAETGASDGKIIYLYPETVLKTMDDGGYTMAQSGIAYTPNQGSFTSHYFSGQMIASSIGNSYFNIAKNNNNYEPVIRNAVYKSQTPSAFCYLETNKPYVIGNGEFVIEFEKFPDNDSEYFWFGLCLTDAEDSTNYYYWDGSTWVTSPTTYFKEKNGAKIPTLGSPITYGYVRLILVGWDSEILSDMARLSLTYQRMATSGRYLNSEPRETNRYSCKNDSVVKDEWDESCIFSTENYSKLGTALVVNPDNSYFKGWNYATHSEASSITPKPSDYAPIVLDTSTQPEQHLVNRVALYWSASRRKIRCNLLASLLPELTPRYKITVDGSTMYPVSISRDWRDDIEKLILMEI